MSQFYTVNGRIFYEDGNQLSLLGDSILEGTTTSSGWVVTGSKAVGTAATQSLTLTNAVSFFPVEGTRYEITFDISSYVSGTVSPIFGGAVYGTPVSGDGVGYKFFVYADAARAASKIHGLEGYAFTGSVDNLSFKKVSVGILSELGASVTLPHKLIQVPVVQAVYAPSIQLDLKLVVAQGPQVDFAGNLTLAHSLTDAMIGELTALIHEVALSLGIKLEQAQATSVAYQVLATLAHELGQAEIGANVIEVAVTFLQKLLELEEPQWTADALASLSLQLGLNQNFGATILVALALDTRHFGPQGAATGAELNPDLGFDTPADWETGAV